MTPKRRYQFLALILAIATLTSSAVAIIYVSRTIDFTASVVTIGDIQVYSDEACTTVLTSYDFPPFDAPSQKLTLDIWIKNLGNVETILRWRMPTSSITFGLGTNHRRYEHFDDTTLVYLHYIWQEPFVDPYDYWYPDAVGGTPETITMAGGEVIALRISLEVSNPLPAPESFTFTDVFEASDA